MIGISMKKLLFQMIASGFGLWLSSLVVPGVSIAVYPDSSFFGFPLNQTWELFVLFGIVLGLLNYFIKPILKALSLPLEIITLGLFSIVINMALIYVVDVIFNELYIPLWLPLVYTTFIIFGLNFVLSLVMKD